VHNVKRRFVFLYQELIPCHVVLVVMMLFEKVSSLYHFKSDLGEIWHDRSSNKYALIDGI